MFEDLLLPDERSAALEAAVVEDPRELRLSDLLVDVADVNRPLDAVAVGALV